MNACYILYRSTQTMNFSMLDHYGPNPKWWSRWTHNRYFTTIGCCQSDRHSYIHFTHHLLSSTHLQINFNFIPHLSSYNGPDYWSCVVVAFLKQWVESVIDIWFLTAMATTVTLECFCGWRSNLSSWISMWTWKYCTSTNTLISKYFT